MPYNEQNEINHLMSKQLASSHTVERQMPLYQCHKKVWALKIKSVERGDALTILNFEDAGYAPISVSYEYDEKHSPHSGGYYIVYEDGYKSFSPTEAFESGYARI